MTAVATLPTPSAVSLMPVNNVLLSAAISAVEGAFTMCGMATRCVGALAVPARDPGTVTGMVGVHGKVSGFVTVNMTERIALRAVGGLLQHEFHQINSQVVDGSGEISNIVVGGIKSALAGTKFAFSQITVPTVIVGRGYSIAYARGLEFLCVTFENEDREALLLEDRLIQVSMSLLSL